MRLTLDPAACDGFGYCVEILRELLSFDEWGFPIVERRAVPGHLLDAARQAAQSCPRRALTVSDLAADGSGDRTRPARRT